MWVLLWLLFLLRRLQLTVEHEHEQHVCLLKGNPSLAKLTTTPHTHSTHSTHSTHCIAIQSGKKENIVMRSASISSPPHHTLTHWCSSRLPHTWLWLQRSSWSQENNNNKHGVFRFRVNTICIGCYNLKICYLAWLNCVISLTKSNSERNL